MDTTIFFFADDSGESSDDTSTHADGGGPADLVGDALGGVLP